MVRFFPINPTITVTSIRSYLVTNEKGEFVITDDSSVMEGNFKSLPACLFDVYYVKER